MYKTTFNVPGMDCPSEENLIRIRLHDLPGIDGLDFNIPKREVHVYHSAPIAAIEDAIGDLNLGGERINTENADHSERQTFDQSKTLWTVLAINFSFFLIEITTGLISGSMGLVADSLDMLADSVVYGISLFAVGGTLLRKKKVARLAGYFQLILALIGFFEVIRRFAGYESIPQFKTMIIVSILALIGNAICLYLLQRAKSDEAHMRASMIFTSNDIIINLGVICAGILVYLLNSNMPDLIIGTIVFILVIQGSLRILKLGK